MAKAQQNGGSKTPQVIFTPVGTAKVIGKSESRARQHFKSKRIPTEYLINGVGVAVSGETLAKIAPDL